MGDSQPGYSRAVLNKVDRLSGRQNGDASDLSLVDFRLRDDVV